MNVLTMERHQHEREQRRRPSTLDLDTFIELQTHGTAYDKIR